MPLRVGFEETEHLATAELAALHDPDSVVDSMDLEEVLGVIKTNGDRGALCATLHGGMILSLDASAAPSLALRCRVRAGRRITSIERR